MAVYPVGPLPPLPKVGDRIYKRGGHDTPGEVLAVVDGDDDGFAVFAARYWFRRRGYYHWECFTSSEWECGLVRPGPVPKDRR